MPSKLNLMIEQELSQRYPAGSGYLVLGCEKLDGHQNTEFRRLLRENRIRMQVVKNSLATRALTANGIGGGVQFLNGPCALVNGKIEMPSMCKVVSELVKKYEGKVVIRGGLMGDMALTPAGVAQLASIPPLPVLHAKFAGSVQAPIARLAGAFQGIARNLACALEAIRNQKEGSAPPSSPETAASGPAPAAG